VGVREEKNDIREKYKALKASISDNEKEAFDQAVFKHFTNSLSYRHCKSIVIYVSRADEVKTTTIIQKALEDGKTIAVPKCMPTNLSMDFFEIKSLDDLEKGTYGILEPNTLCKKVDALNFQLCIVPAVCFDLEGFRIGFGKGYYDRFLEKFTGVKMGLTYSCLITKKLPRGRFDQKIEIIISEKGVSRIEKGNK